MGQLAEDYCNFLQDDRGCKSSTVRVWGLLLPHRAHACPLQHLPCSQMANYLTAIINTASFVAAVDEDACTDAIDQICNLRNQCDAAARVDRLYARRHPAWISWGACCQPCEPCALSGADWLVHVCRGRATHSRGGAAALRELAEKHAACATGEAPERSDLRAAAFCHAVRRFSLDPTNTACSHTCPTLRLSSRDLQAGSRWGREETQVESHAAQGRWAMGDRSHSLPSQGSGLQHAVPALTR